MTKRRLLVVLAGLALAAWVGSSSIQGEPAGKARPASAPANPGKVGGAPDGKPHLAADPEAALAESKFSQQQLVLYPPLQGDPFFGLQVQPPLDPVPLRPRDYLILISASANQAGPPRVAALQIAEAIARNAAAGDRISLWTVSTPKATVCLTKDFVSPGTKAIDDAFTELHKKVYPAGDTDLHTALTRAIKSFDGRPRQRIILFLGDGLSTHRPVTVADRQALCRDMVERHITFFPVPLGLHLSAENLHGLATGTGGMVLRARLAQEKISDLRKRFEQAFAGPVLYPTTFKMPAQVTEHYPERLPPLRSDAPTLVIGRMKKADNLTYTVEGTFAGQERTMSRTVEVKAAEPELDNFFLISMLSQWKGARNGKSQAALVRGDRALALAYEQVRLDHREILTAAELAIDRDEVDAAVRLLEHARQLAPHDGEAAAGLKVLADLRAGKLTRERIKEQLDNGRRQAERVEKVNGVVKTTRTDLAQLARLELQEPRERSVDGGIGVAREDLLQAHRDRVLIEEQKLTQTVEDNLRQASRELHGDPDAAVELLRNTLLRVRDHADLSERVRAALLARLQTALGRMASEGKAILQKKAEKQQALDSVKRREDDEQERKTIEERIEAQFRVFKGQLNLGRFEEKTKQDVIYGLLAMQQEARLKNLPVPVAAQAAYNQVLAGYHLNQYAGLKRLREERFLTIFLQVEKAHVPFPDEPGIYFPPLEMWKALYKLRKEKYEVQSLPDDEAGRREAGSIARLLSETIDMKDFQQPMKLKEALGLFYDKFAAMGKDLPILIDTEAFKEENPDVEDIRETDVQFPQFPRKLAMATALRLALSQVKTRNATYLIRRSFIEITTNDRQTRERVLRVYPVGDLVVPVSGGGLMGLGGGAGFPGGVGGFPGGGGFNFPGGGGGGFNFPGGAGAFNFPGGAGGFNFPGGAGAFNFPGGAGGFNFPGGAGGAGGFNFPGGAGGFNFPGGAGGFNFPGGAGGFNPGGGGFNFPGGAGGFNFPGGAGGFNFPGGAGGLNPGGGGFNGNLGFLGATQASSLIDIITKVVAPGEWFVTQPPVPAGAGFPGPFGFPVPGPVPPPPPINVGGPANIQDANTIEFFPPALALIVRAPSRIHTSIMGGVIGGKGRRIEAAMAIEERGLARIEGNRQGKKGVAGAGEENKNPQLARNDPKKKVLTAEAELDAAKVWEEALAKGSVEPGMVIATADFLFECGKFAHAAEFLKANLRHGIVVRPWVYEALAVALEASRGDPEEVRRARLSALALDPQDAQGFLQAARTMAEHGQYDRALAFCRQAALLEPMLAEPYAEALAFAERGKDSQAMAWAAGKLLSDDWPIDNHLLHRHAQEKLASLARTLKTEQRHSEADQLQTALQRLRQRDLVIRLTWDAGSAPADLDLQVKEPCGSVCSAQQRQTPGGGACMGNNLANMTQVSYAAAQAFTGDYEITVRRNFGQPLGMKARLEIVQHQGTPQESRRLEVIRLNQKTDILKLTLKDGRRQELAAVPPPAAAKRAAAKTETRSDVRGKLRDLAHPDFTGANAGGMRAEASAAGGNRMSPPNHKAEPFVTRLVSPGMNLTAQAVREGNEVAVRLNPVFQTVAPAGSRPRVNLPLIPGSAAP